MAPNPSRPTGCPQGGFTRGEVELCQRRGKWEVSRGWTSLFPEEASGPRGDVHAADSTAWPTG